MKLDATRYTITLADAAAELGLDASTLRHQIANGRLAARKVGPVWLLTPAEVARYREVSRGRPGFPTGQSRPARAVVDQPVTAPTVS